MCSHLPHEQAYWWPWILEWGQDSGAVFPARPGRETRQKTDAVCVHQRPPRTSTCTRLPHSWGAPCHVLALRLCQVDEHPMKCLPAITQGSSQGAEQRGGISAGLGSWLQSMHLPRGGGDGFSFHPSVPFPVTPASHPGGYLPGLPGSQTSRSSGCGPFHIAGGRVTPNRLPKTQMNCAHEKSSHSLQSHCLCDSILSRRNRRAQFILCDLLRSSPSSAAYRREGGSLRRDSIQAHTSAFSPSCF